MTMKEVTNDDAPPPPPQNSTSIISSLMRAELNMHVKQQAWEKIKHLLKSDSDVTRAVDPATGELPLHVLARNDKVPILPIDLAILAYPQALLRRDLNGQLPLHSAAESGSFDVLKIIYEAYKDGRKCFDDAGRLPIHVAAEAKSLIALRFLLDQDPTMASFAVQKPKEIPEESEFLGGLAIHCACRFGASSEIVDVLLSKSGASAKMKDFRGNLPIHSLLKHGNSVDFGGVKALLSAYSSSLKKRNSAGDIPLIIALKHGAKSDIIEYLFQSHPEAAEERSGDGRSPLVLAIENGYDDVAILKILEQSPANTTVIDEKTRLLPIEIATNHHRSPQLIHYLLLEDLPVDLTDHSPAALSNYRSSYQHSWEHIVSNDEYSEVVSNLLQACTHAQRIALAKASCQMSEKSLLDEAAPDCKRVLVVGMRLFGIIELTDIAPAFATDRTSIYYGLKYPEAPAQGVSVVFEGEVGETATPVIVKLTPYRELMERELSVRRDYQLSPEYVSQIYSVHRSEEISSATEAPDGISSPAYCISMEQGLTLENIWLELKRRDANARIPVEDIRQIAKALFHMHDQGLVHGDLGSHNVGKFDDGKYKLLSIGGAVHVGQATDPERGWYFPPEVVISTKKSKLKLKSKPRIVSIAAAPTLDMWSFGVLMYQLLCGVPLSMYARSSDRNANAANVRSWNEKTLGKALAHLRMEDEVAADLLSGLLHPKPSRRIPSMKEVLTHKYFSNEEQKSEKDDVAGISLPSPSPEQIPEVDEMDPNASMLKNPRDVVYPTQERRLQGDISIDAYDSDDTVDANEEARQDIKGSAHRREDATSFISYPVQDLQSKRAPFSYPLQERRIISSVQEKREITAATSPTSSSLAPKDALGDQQSVSSSILESHSAYRCDGDCFSTASTKFTDNTSATIDRATKPEVPVQVVATEKKSRRRSSGSDGDDKLLSDSPATDGKGVDTLPIESYSSIDSDNESEPGRIIPGSRLRKRAAAQKYHDPQLV